MSERSGGNSTCTVRTLYCGLICVWTNSCLLACGCLPQLEGTNQAGVPTKTKVYLADALRAQKPTSSVCHAESDNKLWQDIGCPSDSSPYRGLLGLGGVAQVLTDVSSIRIPQRCHERGCCDALPLLLDQQLVVLLADRA